MLEAYIDTCTGDGLLEGWARFQSRREPCIVVVQFQGEVIARAVADEYRWDLLAAKVGHGHYGFRARLARPIQEGLYEVDVYEQRTGARPSNATSLPLVVPPIVRRDMIRTTVEQLLTRRVEWSDDDAILNADTLSLEEACFRMGCQRFVDVTYMYTLGRRADADGLERYTTALQGGELSATEVFRILMRSEERLNIAAALAAPFSGDYPY